MKSIEELILEEAMQLTLAKDRLKAMGLTLLVMNAITTIIRRD